MKLHRNTVSGAVLLVLAGLYFYATLDLPPGRDEPGPAFFPILLSGALLVIGLALLVKNPKESAERRPPPAHHPSTRKAIAAMALTMLYVAAFTTIGFVISTWLYTLSVTLTFRRDRPIVAIVIPILSTLMIYLLFDVGLGARLPSGFWVTP